MAMFDDDDLVAWVSEPDEADKREATAALQRLIAERDDLIKERDEALEAVDEDMLADLNEARDCLEAVRYWFHDVLILNKPMTPPRRILAIVERAMGI
jgi:hypothetical protein